MLYDKTLVKGLIVDLDSHEELLQAWSVHVRKQREKHEDAARHYDKWHHVLGFLAAGFSAAVGGAVFLSLEKKAEGWEIFLVGFVSILSSVLVSVSTSLNWAQLAEAHRAAGVDYKCSLRELERLLVKPAKCITEDDVKRIEERLNELEKKSPVVPLRIHEKIEEDWGKRFEDEKKKKENEPKIKLPDTASEQ